MHTTTGQNVHYQSNATSEQLLVRICENENIPHHRVINFVQQHFLERRGLSTQLRTREPVIAFGLEQPKQLTCIVVRLLVDS